MTALLTTRMSTATRFSRCLPTRYLSCHRSFPRLTAVDIVGDERGNIGGAGGQRTRLKHRGIQPPQRQRDLLDAVCRVLLPVGGAQEECVPRGETADGQLRGGVLHGDVLLGGEQLIVRSSRSG